MVLVANCQQNGPLFLSSNPMYLSQESLSSHSVQLQLQDQYAAPNKENPENCVLQIP